MSIYIAHSQKISNVVLFPKSYLVYLQLPKEKKSNIRDRKYMSHTFLTVLSCTCGSTTATAAAVDLPFSGTFDKALVKAHNITSANQLLRTNKLEHACLRDFWLWEIFWPSNYQIKHQKVLSCPAYRDWTGKA